MFLWENRTEQTKHGILTLKSQIKAHHNRHTIDLLTQQYVMKNWFNYEITPRSAYHFRNIRNGNLQFSIIVFCLNCRRDNFSCHISAQVKFISSDFALIFQSVAFDLNYYTTIMLHYCFPFLSMGPWILHFIDLFSEFCYFK